MQESERQLAMLSEEGRYRLLIEAVTDYAIYMLDANGVVTSWNPGAQRFKGYTPQEIIGENFARFYSAEDQKNGIPQRGLKIAREKGNFEAEGWRYRKDGTKFWAHVVIDPIRTPTGEVVGYAKITRDLTERRAAEEALRRSEEQFKRMVEGVTDYAIYMLDLDGNVVSWNAGARRIKGYDPEEIIGRHFSTFYSAEDKQLGIPREALSTALREGKYEKEGWRVRKDGTRFFASVVIDLIKGSDGEPIGFAKITRDVTERKKAERELETAREALFQSQKMDAIGQLTGGVAHDFNNLLAAVLGSLELVKKKNKDPSLDRLLDNAVEGAKRGASLTQRMLAFARRQDLQVAPLDIAKVVANMRGLLESSLGSSYVIEDRIPKNVGNVLGDANQMELAILNIAVNARDAMPDGGTITFDARMTSQEAKRFICLSISDKGVGMNEEQMRRALEPFYTTKGIGKGTGLGLSMVHGMVEQLGGKLTLKSKPGEGTTIELCLPLASGGEAEAAVHRGDNTDPAEGQLLILAVDDDKLVLTNTSAMLEDLGHRVLEAHSGKVALSILRDKPDIDLVITDQSMPGMTGIQLAKAIKAENPAMPIIIATGYSELPEYMNSDLPKLAKPFLQKDLADAIASAGAGFQ